MFAIAGSVPRIQWLISPHRWLYTFAIFNALSTNTQVLQTLLDVVQKQSDDIAALVATNQQLHEDVQSLVSVNEKLSADMQGLLASLRGALNEPATDQAETKPKTSLFKRFFG